VLFRSLVAALAVGAIAALVAPVPPLLARARARAAEAETTRALVQS
jgi:hypothetical protein